MVKEHMEDAIYIVRQPIGEYSQATFFVKSGIFYLETQPSYEKTWERDCKLK